MAPLECASCSAPLTLPDDLRAVEAVCGYCQKHTPLPTDLVRVRLDQQAEIDAQRAGAEVRADVKAAGRRASSMALWIVLLTTLLPLVITGVVLAQVFRATPHMVVPHPRHR